MPDDIFDDAKIFASAEEKAEASDLAFSITVNQMYESALRGVIGGMKAKE